MKGENNKKNILVFASSPALMNIETTSNIPHIRGDEPVQQPCTHVNRLVSMWRRW